MWITKIIQELNVENLICLGVLTGISVYDILFRKISGFVLMLGSILAIGYGLTVSENPWYICAAGAAVGGILLGIAYVTDQAVGYGDGWLLAALGVYLGIWAVLEVLIVAWGLMAGAAAVCLVKKRWSRHAALPMTPFVTFGFIIFMVSECIYE